MIQKFSDCKKANLKGLEDKLFSSRIEALQYLQKLNPKKVITYDRRCSEIDIDGNLVTIQFKKQNNCFKFYVINFYDDSLSNRWDDYMNETITTPVFNVADCLNKGLESTGNENECSLQHAFELLAESSREVMKNK